MMIVGSPRAPSRKSQVVFFFSSCAAPRTPRFRFGRFPSHFLPGFSFTVLREDLTPTSPTFPPQPTHSCLLYTVNLCEGFCLSLVFFPSISILSLLLFPAQNRCRFLGEYSIPFPPSECCPISFRTEPRLRLQSRPLASFPSILR